MFTSLLAVLFFVGIQHVQAQSGSTDEVLADTMALHGWIAGQTVTPQAVEAWGGEERCFTEGPIPDRIWERMQGKTYKNNSPIGRAQLRHVRALHWDYDGQIHIGEMVCNKRIAERLVRILRTLYAHRYPIQRMLLPDIYDADDERQMRDNNSSCFCCRVVSGSKKLSKHAQGLAVDINPLYNPYYKKRADGTQSVKPATAAPYCDRKDTFPYKIDHEDLCFRLFVAAGFKWGGDWKSCKDFQHFEFN